MANPCSQPASRRASQSGVPPARALWIWDVADGRYARCPGLRGTRRSTSGVTVPYTGMPTGVIARCASGRKKSAKQRRR